MKNFKFIFAFTLIIFATFFSSCQKEEINTQASTSLEDTQDNNLFIKGFGEIDLNKEYKVEDFKDTDLYKSLQKPTVENLKMTEDWRLIVYRNNGIGNTYSLLSPYNHSVLGYGNGFSPLNLLHPDNYPNYSWKNNTRVRVYGNDRFNSGHVFLVEMKDNASTFTIRANAQINVIHGGETRYYRYKSNNNSWEMEEYFPQ